MIPSVSNRIKTWNWDRVLIVGFPPPCLKECIESWNVSVVGHPQGLVNSARVRERIPYNGKTIGWVRALIRRVVERVAPSIKVWCSRLGSTKTRRFQITYTLKLRFLNTRNSLLRKSGNFWLHFFVVRQWEKVSFSGVKTGIKISRCEWVRSRASWLMNKNFARKLSSLVLS